MYGGRGQDGGQNPSGFFPIVVSTGLTSHHLSVIIHHMDPNTILADLAYKPTHKKQLTYKFWDLRVRTFVDMPRLSYAINRVEGLRVPTIVAGEKETSNTAKKGDIIVSGPLGEKYVIRKEKFAKLYVGNIGGPVTPEQGTRMVAKYDGNTTLDFRAPWGDPMIAKPGDWIVRESDGKGYYRIAKIVFDVTYERPA